MPLNSPLSAMSISREFCRFASTLPSTISRSQEVISPDSVISRPTIRLRASASPRRGLNGGAAAGASPARRGGSAARGFSPAARSGSGVRGGTGAGARPSGAIEAG